MKVNISGENTGLLIYSDNIMIYHYCLVSNREGLGTSL